MELVHLHQARQHVRLKIAPLPVVENGFVKDKEARIDPLVLEVGLLADLLDPSRSADIDHAVLRIQRHAGHGDQAGVAVVELDQIGQRHIRQPVAIGDDEAIAQLVATGHHTLAGVGVLAGVHHLDGRTDLFAFEVIVDHALAVAGGQHELGEAALDEQANDLTQDGRTTHGHHGLGHVFTEWKGTYAFATTQNQHLHNETSFRWSPCPGASDPQQPAFSIAGKGTP